MRAHSTDVVFPAEDEAPSAVSKPLSARILGISIVSLLPALFWCVVLKAGAASLGAAISATTIAITFCAISLFLAVICAPLVLRG